MRLKMVAVAGIALGLSFASIGGQAADAPRCVVLMPAVERNGSGEIAALAGQMLGGLGVPFAKVGHAELTSDGLRGVREVFAVRHDVITGRVESVLKTFAARGGQVIRVRHHELFERRRFVEQMRRDAAGGWTYWEDVFRRNEDRRQRELQEVRAMPAVPGELHHTSFHDFPWRPDFDGREMSFDEAVGVLKALGFNSLSSWSHAPNVAHYRSKVLPVDPAVAARGDMLDEFVAACRRHKVRSYASLRCLMANGREFFGDYRRWVEKDGRAGVDRNGKADLNFLCPSHPLNRKLVVDAAVEMASRGVDGVSLDCIRYKDPNFCHCARCRQGVAAAGGNLDAYRKETIRTLVKEVHDALKAACPRVVLSASPFPTPDAEGGDRGQAWDAWCREGLLDEVCPMDYWRGPDALYGLYVRQRKFVQGVPSYPCFGPILWADDFHREIRSARIIAKMREAGLKGFHYFTVNRREMELIRELAKGPLRLAEDATKTSAAPVGAIGKSPEALGVSSKGISSWIDACERELKYVHGFVLMRHGEVVAEGSWAPYDTLTKTHMLYSHSKSFTSTAVGFLVDDGKLDLDERVIDILPDKAPANPSENLRQLRVRDLLTMNVGAKRTDAEKDDRFGDWEKAFLANAIDSRPGTVFRYDSGATYMLAAIVERRSGEKMMDFLRRRLFEPLGIAKAWSTASPSGTPCGGWGMNMTTRELAKFGQLYLRQGLWNGRRILSSEWVALATSRQTWSGAIAVAGEDGSDWHQGYGFQFWRCKPGFYRADGANGQLTIVMPQYDAVMSVHAGLGNMQKELSLIWKHIVPAMAKEPLPEDASAAAALAEKIAKLAIAPEKGARSGDEPFVGRDFALGGDVHGISSVRLDRSADGWTCVLRTAAGEQRFPVGNGAWKTGELVFDSGTVDGLGAIVGRQPIAASAGVGADGVLRLRSLVTSGPHRLDFDFRATPKGPTVTGALIGIGGGALASR